MIVPFVIFDEEFFLDQARFLAELSHAEVKMDVSCFGYGTEWQVVYRFGLYFITLRFKIGIQESHTLTEAQADSARDHLLILEWEHFRVSPRHQGLGKRFTEIFLEELRLTPVKQVILQPKNENAARFWQAAGFRSYTGQERGLKDYLYLDL